MNDNYDVIVLGTGLTECIISGLLSISGKKVLHLDRNSYYGGESASLNLEQMYQKFRGNDIQPPQSLGRSRDYNIDLIPKYLMANGRLKKILVATGITRYNMEFMLIDGSFVLRDKKIYKVPCTAMEVAKSPLLGFFEKGRAKKLLSYVHAYKQEDQSTWQGLDLTKATMDQVYKKFGVDENTIDFLGHSVALHTNDAYLNQPALPTVESLKLYADSLAMFGKSPYLYPLYGLGELPQVFARLCAVYGGTYMLHKPVDKILYDENGKVCGVESEGEVAKSTIVVGDPSYFQDKVRKTGKVVRVICLLNHPIPNTENSKSAQIILPQKQVGRKHDIYINCVSDKHKVTPNNIYVAIVSTTAETNDPEKEVEPGLALLGPILDKFVYVLDTFEPLEDGRNDGVFISKSYDPTAHFESSCADVVSLYERITGNKFDLDEIERKAKERTQQQE
jgi:Rab GDP dissociation inhibitor